MTSGFKDHFGSVAADYARYRPVYPAVLFEHLAALCARREQAWDCACGSGQATLALAQHFTRVSGTDASVGQLAQAPPCDGVEWRCAPAEASGLPDRSVDLVTVAQALHWLPLTAFYAEVQRTLVPGGVLAIWSYGKLALAEPALDELVQSFYAETVGPFWPAERRHIVNGYRDLPFPYAELAAPAFEIKANWTLEALAGYLRSWSATAAFSVARGFDPVAPLADELVRVWPKASTSIDVTWPLQLRTGRKPY